MNKYFLHTNGSDVFVIKESDLPKKPEVCKSNCHQSADCECREFEVPQHWLIMGVCRAVFESINGRNYDGHDWEVEAEDFLRHCGIYLPEEREFGYCWPVNPEGDEQRREFLRSHIERLKKEL